MNISCDEESAFDIEVEYDPYKQVFNTTIINNHDDNGITTIKYKLTRDDIEYLVDYLKSKLK
jgi:hypothetical protein